MPIFVTNRIKIFEVSFVQKFKLLIQQDFFAEKGVWFLKSFLFVLTRKHMFGVIFGQNKLHNLSAIVENGNADNFLKLTNSLNYSN